MRTARLAPLVLLLLMTMNMTTAPAARADKSYRMPAVRITADLARDGSMQVREERTYRFKGRFKYAYRTYALDDRIDYEDFRVSENGRPYVQSDSEEPGTYKVTHGAEEVEVRWFYRARNETRTFAIDYGVRDAVHRHRDAAVLYYKFIGKGFKKRTDQVDITVNPPVAVEDWKVRQWAHGPLWGESRTSNDGVVTASCTKLPRRRFFELRILYPPELFPEAFERAGYVSASVTEEEAAWAEEANQERRRAVEKRDKLKKRQAVALRMVPVVVLLAWFWFVRLWRRQRRLFPGQGSIPVSTWSAPDDLPPALVSYLLNSRSVVASSLMATLMDLGRRGFVEFREEYVAKVGFLGREKWEPRHHWVLKTDHLEGHRAELLPFETELLDFVFEEMTGQRTDTVDSRAFRKKRSKVRSFFGRWSRMVKKEGASRAWFAEESIKARNRALWMAAGLTALGVMLLFVVHAVGLLAVVPGVIMLLCAFALVRPTAEGGRRIARYKGLQRHLRKGKFRQEDPSRMGQFMNAYFIYGVLFGLSKGRLRDLGKRVPDDGASMSWYHPAVGSHGGDFGTSFSAAVSAVGSTMSSATGAGGGASGGGGGGAGGGGGGAG